MLKNRKIVTSNAVAAFLQLPQQQSEALISDVPRLGTQANQTMLKTVNSMGSRSGTALKASSLNHSEAIDGLARGKVEYLTSSTRYGSRHHALEQVGAHTLYIYIHVCA